MAARAEAVPAWQRGKVASWLVTTDHKRIGILYIWTALVFLLISGLMAIFIRLQLSQANADVLSPERYNELITSTGRRWSSSSACRSSPASISTEPQPAQDAALLALIQALHQ